MATGTLRLSDLLSNETQQLLTLDQQELVRAVERELRIHSDLMREQLSVYATPTTNRVGTYGSPSALTMKEVGEERRVVTQKTRGYAQVAYPLRAYQVAIGYTADFLRRGTAGDFLRQFNAARMGHRLTLVRQLKRALYLSSNYTVRDLIGGGTAASGLGDALTLSVKRLLNADGDPIPTNSSGVSFDGATHTHYDALDYDAAAQAAKDAAWTDLVNDVVEHDHTNRPVIFINVADVARVKLSANFNKVVPSQIIPSTAADHARGTLDTSVPPDNRMVGIMDDTGAEVWTKPWAIANYAVCIDIGAGAEDKPLRLREEVALPSRGLRLEATNALHPIQADFMVSMFGFGAHTRTNGAVLYLGGGAYVDPTIN